MNSDDKQLIKDSVETEQIASSIHGWMTATEIRWLIETARSMGSGRVAVEIGSYKGRSSVAIGRSLHRESILYCVDSWFGDPYDIDDLSEDLYSTWLNNVLCHAFSCPIVPIRQPSVRAATLFAPASIDWVFIDGSHLFEHVARDIEVWIPKLRSGGIISGHDYVGDCPGVVEAVDEAFPERKVEDKIWWSRV